MHCAQRRVRDLRPVEHRDQRAHQNCTNLPQKIASANSNGFISNTPAANSNSLIGIGGGTSPES